MKTSPPYLVQRRHTWSVRVQIPKRLWAAAGGKRHYVKTLKTRDVNVANDRKHAYVAAFKAKIRALEEIDPTGALGWRAAIEAAKTGGTTVGSEDAHHPPEMLADFLRDQALDKARSIQEEDGEEAADAFHRVVTMPSSGTVREHLETWLGQERHVTAQTIKMHRAAVNAFLKWAGDDVGVHEVDRRKAGDYINTLLDADAVRLDSNTVQRHASSLSTLWGWLEERGVARADSNPWKRQGIAKKSKRGVARPRQQWTDDEIVKLLTGHATEHYTATFHDLIRLALVTGARISDLCELRTTDAEKRADGWWIKINEGKTSAAVRQVPVHDSAAHVLERRVALSAEFLFPTLVPGGPDKKRSWNVVKAFTRYRRALGLGDDAPSGAASPPGHRKARKVFHSLRKTFTEAMEAAEVVESTTQLIIGQKRVSLAYGLYSGGHRVELRKAINKLKFSKDLMVEISRREPTTAKAK